MKKCVIIRNIYNKKAMESSETVMSFLTVQQVASEVFDYAGDTGTFQLPDCDFVITLGGDGTVLFASRICAPRGIPVFPVNFGEFGFIAGVSKDDWERPLMAWLDGTSSWTERTLLYGQVIRRNNAGINTVFSSTALNDVVVRTTGVAQLAELQVSADDEPFGKFRSDGIIVATPTGSTAYSAAAGGPIVDPSVEALILSPINAFSLSNRPIVLKYDSVISVTVLSSRGADMAITFDGQQTFVLQPEDVITITSANEKVRLIGCEPSVFYSALRSKLQWRATVTH